MKQLIATAAAVFLSTTISYHTFAHSNLGESNPTDGEVVTEPLNEITLQFDGQIEQGSFIEVTTTSGQAIELQDIVIGDGTLAGTFAEPLPNDDYQAKWSIISADGHPLDGEFAFTVNMPATELEEEASEEASETTGAVEETTEANNQSAEAQEGATADEVKEDSSPTTMLIVVLFILIIAGGLFFFNKKRK